MAHIPTDELCACGHHNRYHFTDGTGYVRCRATSDCNCARRDAIPSKEQALAKWLPTCQWGDLKDAFCAGWDARAAGETTERPMPQAGDACDLCLRSWVQLPNAGLWHECMPKRRPSAEKTPGKSADKQRFVIAISFDESAVDGRDILRRVAEVPGVTFESMLLAPDVRGDA